MTASPQNFRDLLKTRAGLTPDCCFITEPDGGQRLTFGEAFTKTELLAKLLTSQGLQPGDRVIISAPNSAAAAIGLLSVIGCGAVAVPVNPLNSESEFKYLIEHSQAKMALSAVSKAADFKAKAFPAIESHVETDFDLDLFQLSGIPNPAPAIPDLAILLYTSGTTGRPKGVMLTNQNLLSECANIALAHQLTGKDKALCLLPLNHVNGLVVTLLTPLYVGFEVVMPEKFSASNFWNWVINHQVSWFSAVPTILTILLGRSFPPKQEVKKSLRFLRSASSALPPDVPIARR
jgi:acyl-CoA synthetase (AMP-forming)/AMP-acid ligase II